MAYSHCIQGLCLTRHMKGFKSSHLSAMSNVIQLPYQSQPHGAVPYSSVVSTAKGSNFSPVSNVLSNNFVSTIGESVISTILARSCSTHNKKTQVKNSLCGREYPADQTTNITPKIISLMERKLHLTPGHPLCHLKQRIVQFMQSRYTSKRGNPVFSVVDDLAPVVTTRQNFDELLVAQDHVCRSKTDNYYINRDLLLRAHTSAHQSDLLRSGLDNFLVVGDVYRRDDIDASHYSVFHQMEGVRLYTPQQLLPASAANTASILTGCPSTGACSPDDCTPQAAHTPAAVEALTSQLQGCLEDMARGLFGQECQLRWVSAHFPFTQPSWELEVLCEGDWVEILGCGIMQQRILEQAGVEGKVGWAFGLGLERWAMKLYAIPDIRLFWSRDSGFLSQFDFQDHNTDVQYEAVSKYPQCQNDISFWLPKDGDIDCHDFYDLVRDVGGDLVEQVKLFDVFSHPKRGQTSHAYRITYRHNERTLLRQEVNEVHDAISRAAEQQLGVTIR